MTQKRHADGEPSRYMTFQEIALQLRVSAESVRDKALKPGSDLAAVDVGNGTERAQWRVPRSAFDAYCERIERESAARFDRAS